METTWKTPGGWIVVRDALTMGPWDHEDAVTPHTRPPADDDADHMDATMVTTTNEFFLSCVHLLLFSLPLPSNKTLGSNIGSAGFCLL